MLLSHDEILDLVERGVIQNAKPEAVNASSIDVHLGNTIMIEDFYWGAKIIDYRDREKPFMRKIDIDENGFGLRRFRSLPNILRRRLIAIEFQTKIFCS